MGRCSGGWGFTSSHHLAPVAAPFPLSRGVSGGANNNIGNISRIDSFFIDVCMCVWYNSVCVYTYGCNVLPNIIGS